MIITEVLDSEWPLSFALERDKERGSRDFDIGFDELDSTTLIIGLQSNVNRAYIFHVDWFRPENRLVAKETQDFTHQMAFRPGYATSSSFSGSRRVQRMGDEAPGWRSIGSFPPYSRQRIIALVAFLTMKRGARVITFVKLYLPDPGVQDTPR
jgi:hypothetical protein